MKKLLFLGVLALAAFAVWKHVGNQAGNDAISDLEHRLQKAESTYKSAGRAAGVSGMDTSGDAEIALNEVRQVEKELRDLSRTATKPEDKDRIRRLLETAVEVRHKMG
jgi:hypothetical protein